MGPRCSFCGTERGTFLEVEVGLRLQMCPDCQAACGHGPEPLLAAYDLGQPYLQRRALHLRLRRPDPAGNPQVLL